MYIHSFTSTCWTRAAVWPLSPLALCEFIHFKPVAFQKTSPSRYKYCRSLVFFFFFQNKHIVEIRKETQLLKLRITTAKAPSLSCPRKRGTISLLHCYISSSPHETSVLLYMRSPPGPASSPSALSTENMRKTLKERAQEIRSGLRGRPRALIKQAWKKKKKKTFWC